LGLTAHDVLGAIVDHARAYPDRLAAKDSDQNLSYGELCDEAARLAAGLRARGVHEGDRIALLLPNSIDFVVATLASLWIGAIFVPLAVNNPTARQEILIGDCSPAIVVTSDGHEDGTPRPASLGETPSIRISDLRSLDTDLPAPVRHCEHAYVIYTSGTTGNPKGVLIGNTAFAAAVEAASLALGLNRDTIALCVSPFHFDGSFGTLFPTLFSGGTIVIRPRDALLFPRTFFNTVAQEAVTFTGFTPSYLRILLSSPQISQLAVTSLEVVAIGGEALFTADIRALWMAAPQVKIFNRYGPTETAIAVTHMELTPETIAGGVAPIGQPHSGVTFYLIDERGELVVRGNRIGELHIGGSQLMAGYWCDPALTAEVLRTDMVKETVYRTGDLMYRDELGDYVYVGRTDGVIKRLGVRISLIELGDVVRNLPGVSAATCATYDEGGQLGIVAFVVTDGQTTPEDIWSGLQEQLPNTMLPDRIKLVDALPLTQSGKLDEHRLLAEAGLQETGASTVVPSGTAIRF